MVLEIVEMGLNIPEVERELLDDVKRSRDFPSRSVFVA